MRMKNHHIAAAMLLLAALFAFLQPSSVQSQFASQNTWGGTTAGTANAQTMAVANYRLNVGVPITALAGSANTASTTLNINGTGAVVVKRATANAGVQNLVGGELVVGLPFTVVYDGTNYRLTSRPPDWVGQTAEFRTNTVPAGYFIEDGSCQSQTGAQFVALFAALGSTYGTGCGGAGTFSIPDSRGRTSYALDNQGSNGSASRMTNCTAALASGCGSQNSSLTNANQLPSFTVAGSVSISDSRTWGLTNAGQGVGPAGTPSFQTAGSPGFVVTGGVVAVTGGSIGGSFSVSAGGSSQVFAVNNPTLPVIRAIKL